MSSAWSSIVNELSGSRSNFVEATMAHKPEQDLSHVQEQSVPTTAYRSRVCLPHEALAYFYLKEEDSHLPVRTHFKAGRLLKQTELQVSLNKTYLDCF